MRPLATGGLLGALTVTIQCHHATPALATRSAHARPMPVPVPVTTIVRISALVR
ncbi:MAG: hypothetical protein M3Z27_05495 [Actinomycetota bacterium]|nr:hypothetical protein [Actinomycetota bacterium]